ncbi:testis development related protein [Columba livia]|uniref:Testis development related protein n=1 Tax=Columba livia TaxID=8932 RepID=A0A2I0MTR6_COLLI|nr:testis development related protein [Columba livia]
MVSENGDFKISFLSCTYQQVQGASFRGWKEVTSMFNKDDEQQLLAGCKSPKSKGTNLKLKEEMKSEKKPGFWDSLVIKQNIQSRKPDEMEGWEPPQVTAADSPSDAATALSDYTAWSGWEDETKGSTKYTNLASSGNSSRFSELSHQSFFINKCSGYSSAWVRKVRFAPVLRVSRSKNGHHQFHAWSLPLQTP